MGGLDREGGRVRRRCVEEADGTMSRFLRYGTPLPTVPQCLRSGQARPSIFRAQTTHRGRRRDLASLQGFSRSHTHAARCHHQSRSVTPGGGTGAGAAQVGASFRTLRVRDANRPPQATLDNALSQLLDEAQILARSADWRRLPGESVGDPDAGLRSRLDISPYEGVHKRSVDLELGQSPDYCRFQMALTMQIECIALGETSDRLRIV